MQDIFEKLAGGDLQHRWLRRRRTRSIHSRMVCSATVNRVTISHAQWKAGTHKVQPDVQQRAGAGRGSRGDALAEGAPLVGAHVVRRIQRRQLPRQAQVAVHGHQRPAART